ncbi:MAG: C39 family peptidase [Chloroflexota bacterium]
MPQYGMNIDPNNANHGAPDNPTELRGVKWVRLVFNAEPHSGKSFDQLCAFYDSVIDTYAGNGLNIRTLFVLNHQIALDIRRGANGEISQNYIDRFATRCGEIALRFRGKGVAYEIWNEQDLGSDSAAPVRSDVFKNLLAAVCQKIKDADPDAKRIFGGLASGNAIQYLKDCRDAQGHLPVHAIGIHPYTKFYDSTSLASDLKNISNIFGLHIWLTEFDDGGITPDVEQRAAASLRTYAQILPSVVDVALWYGWSDGMKPGFGLLKGDGNRKQPVYDAFFEIVGAHPGIDHDIPLGEGAAFTNQNLINAFFKAAQASGDDVWKMLANSGLSFLMTIKPADRKKPYTGTSIDNLPNLTQQQKDLIKQALPQPTLGVVPAPAARGFLAAIDIVAVPVAASPSEFKLNIQWVTQMDNRGSGNNDCGDACVFMLLVYNDLPVPSRQEVYAVLQGKTNFKQLIGLAQKYDLTITSEGASVEPLRALLNEGKPVIFPVDYKMLGFRIHLADAAHGGHGANQGPHWLVVVGYDDTGFFVHDPLWMPNTPNGQGGLGGSFLHIKKETLNAALLPNNMLHE